MYEHDGKLLARDATGVLVESTLTVLADGAYRVVPTGATHTSRPKGAVITTVDEVIRRHQLHEGDSYPVQHRGAPTANATAKAVKNMAAQAKAEAKK